MATTSTTAQARSTIRGGGARIGLPDASISKGIFGDEEATDHYGKEAGRDQSQPLLDKVADLMLYLMPHYVKEGKSYLTKLRMGSPYMRNSSASMKKRSPRVIIDSSTNMKKS